MMGLGRWPSYRTQDAVQLPLGTGNRLAAAAVAAGVVRFETAKLLDSFITSFGRRGRMSETRPTQR